MKGNSEYACRFCAPEAPDPNCAWCKGTGFDTGCRDLPICPYCGAEMSTDDLWESEHRDCGECGAVVEVEVEYQVYYTTRRILKQGEEPGKRGVSPD